jgi:hypothetical protein
MNLKNFHALESLHDPIFWLIVIMFIVVSIVILSSH